MLDQLEKVKGYLGVLGSGMMKQMAPEVASGFINELFRQWHVDVAMVTQYVQNNESLWDRLPPDTRTQIGSLLKKVGSLDFFTPEFLITSIKKNFSGVASLFLNWPEAAEWLERQVKDFKTGLEQGQ